MAKYDKILSELLTTFYTNNKIEENVRKIVEQVINLEMTKLDFDKAWGIRDQITNIINEAALQVQKSQAK
jgi:hypothetical protein